MKAFLALACLALASADPLSYLATPGYGVGVGYTGVPYGIHPYGIVPNVVNSYINSDMYQQGLMNEQLKDMSVELNARNAGDKTAEQKAKINQQLAQDDKVLLKYTGLVNNVRVAKREADPLTAIVAPGLNRLSYGINPFRSFYGINSIYNPYVATAGVRYIGKREAEADPALLYRTNPYTTGLFNTYSGLVNPLFNSHSAFVNPYNAFVNPLVPSVMAKKAVVNPETNQIVQADFVDIFGRQSTLANDRAKETPEYAGRGTFVSSNPGATHIAKREAEPYTIAQANALFGYRYGLGYSLGHPFGAIRYY